MVTFLQNPYKVSLTTLISTAFVTLILILILSFFPHNITALNKIVNVLFGIALPLLMVVPIIGLIYSFFIIGKRKIVFILIHFIFICTISFMAFLSLMFRYFIPFAP